MYSSFRSYMRHIVISLPRQIHVLMLQSLLHKIEWNKDVSCCRECRISVTPVTGKKCIAVIYSLLLERNMQHTHTCSVHTLRCGFTVMRETQSSMY